MTCVYKEYEVRINMEKEQGLQLKMKFLLSCNVKIVIYCGKQKFGRGGVYLGNLFLVIRMCRFWVGEGDSSIPQ